MKNNNLDPHLAIKWLDYEVRTKYVTGSDTEPSIESRLLEYIVGEGFPEFWNNTEN